MGTGQPTSDAAAPQRPGPADARRARIAVADRAGQRSRAMRVAMVFGTIGLGFAGIGGQLVRLAVSEQSTARTSISRPLTETFSRPDIVDRNGIILATDVVMQSLFADPSQLLGARETLEALSDVLPGIDTPAMRRTLSNRERRFVWLRRGLSPATAQKIHELGLPGLEFKPEPKRSYPQGRVAGHIIGHVNIDNKGTSGIERYVDQSVGVEQVVGSPAANQRRVRLTVDIRAQTALEQELSAAIELYQASAATGVILDVETGAVRAAASLPSVDPTDPIQAQHLEYLDRLMRGTYELGSIFKAITIAMALEKRTITTRTVFDVRNPIEIGRFRIKDDHSAGRPLTATEIFTHSSNVGAGLIALEVGEESQKKFLARLGLLQAMSTDAGLTAEPQLPQTWGKAEVVTVAYGHGLAVAPLQFAAAGAALVNGGFVVVPQFVESITGKPNRQRVLSMATSAEMRRLMRLNVTAPDGTGRRADAPGYEVGGKTGTADRASGGSYDGRAVITSFFAAFPISQPRYVVLVTLHDPKGRNSNARSGREGRSAALNAAPTVARVITRTAPLLGVLQKSGQ